MVKAKVFVIVKRFEGEPKPTDLKIVEETLPPVKNGEILSEAVAWSVDPYMRLVAAYIPIGGPMVGAQVAKVLESKHSEYKVGDMIVGDFGWRTHTVCDPDKVMSPFGHKSKPYHLPEMKGIPPSFGVGVLGMPGNAAYFGLLELCKPKSGETVVVSGAAGAVGSLVGQIAKIKGCRVIGFAGSDDKVQWLKNDLKFDYAFNYKKIKTLDALKEAAPKGVDCYFDNVGGVMSSEVISAMNEFGRVACCGSISQYNNDLTQLPQAPVLQPHIVLKQLKIEGFIVQRWGDRWMEGINQNKQWLKEGKLKPAEHVTQGFENMMKAFIGMMKGENRGKAVIVA